VKVQGLGREFCHIIVVSTPKLYDHVINEEGTLPKDNSGALAREARLRSTMGK